MQNSTDLNKAIIAVSAQGDGIFLWVEGEQAIADLEAIGSHTLYDVPLTKDQQEEILKPGLWYWEYSIMWYGTHEDADCEYHTILFRKAKASDFIKAKLLP